MNRKNIKLFSFFSGSGLLDLGFEAAGFQVEFVNEICPSFMDAYKYTRKKLKTHLPKYGYFNNNINDFFQKIQDRNKLENYLEDARKDGSLTGFIGGPPCPDFSAAGKNKGRYGTNGKLSSSYIQLISVIKPDFFLFENVKGLWRTAKHREYYKELKEILHIQGYIMTEQLVNAMEYGVPQDRDRVLLFGVHENTLNRIGNKNISSFIWDRYQIYHLDEIKNIEWPGMEEFHTDIMTPCPQAVLEDLTVEHWFRKNDVINHPNGSDYFVPRTGLAKMQMIQEGDVSRKSYKRLHRWRYSPTAAYGNNEVHLHPYKARRLSVAEAMAVQSLPKEFELPPDMTLTDKFKTIGNGVPFLLANGIAKTIDDFLRE